MNRILVFGALDFQAFVDETVRSLEELHYLVGRPGEREAEIRNRYFTCRLEFVPAASGDLSRQEADGYVLLAKPLKMPRRELVEESVVLAAPIASKAEEFYLDEDGLMFEYTLSADELAFLLATTAYKHFSPLPETDALARRARSLAQEEQDRLLEDLLADVKDARARQEVLRLRDAVRKMMGEGDEAADTFGAVVALMAEIQPYIKALPGPERKAAASAVMLILGDTLDAAGEAGEGEEAGGPGEGGKAGEPVEAVGAGDAGETVEAVEARAAVSERLPAAPRPEGPQEAGAPPAGPLPPAGPADPASPADPAAAPGGLP